MSSLSAMPPTLQRPAWPPGRASRLEDRQFALMRATFEATGGLWEGDRAAQLLRRHRDQPISLLAHWIVERKLVSLRWQGATWVPLFQFEPVSMAQREGLQPVLDELLPIFDEWDLALWFASPNDALDESTPAGMLAADPAGVLAAARRDRFIAKG